MTAIRRDGNDTPFGDWIRAHPGLHSIRERLSIMDTDYWIHQYRAHSDKVGDRLIDSIMCVELKTFQNDLPFAQRDTLRLISAMYRQVAYTKDGKIRTMRLDMGNEIRIVRMYGYFVLRLHADRPDTSAWIEWNGRQIDEDTLVDLLRFRRDPRTLNERSERRHHAPSLRQSHPDLFRLSESA
jgi:hypothetical protein